MPFLIVSTVPKLISGRCRLAKISEIGTMCFIASEQFDLSSVDKNGPPEEYKMD